jgi:ABC-type transport system involved in multi-copper enzyme maturation permease subunit
MDAVIVLFFFLVSVLIAALGYLFKATWLVAIAGIAFLLTGLSFITAGIDVQTNYATTTTFNATDLYAYTWNTTFNTTAIANVTTALNKTTTQTFTYNNETTNYTRFIAILIMFVGLLVTLAGYDDYKRGKAIEGSAE